jgi:hypothetical protein
MKLVFILIIMFLVIVDCSLGVVSNDVILEKLDTMNSNIIEIKESIVNATIARDMQIKEDKIARDIQIKEINTDIVNVKLWQSSADVRINIIWGILGTTFGSSGVYGLMVIRRKRNGKVESE